MSFLSGGVAVVTGASSGIGRALALRLSASGSALALADIDEKGLAETAALLSNKAGAISTHTVDVSDETRVKTFSDEVLAKHGRVTLLINNAGVALHGTFDEISLDDFRWLMGINFWGTVYGVRYFLPALRKEQRAHIVNLSSVFGIIAPVGQTAYSTSKFAVRGFTESLRHELAGGTVSVTAVHPGGIQTPIAVHARTGTNAPKNAKEESVAMLARLARTSADEAAACILRGVERRDPRVLIGSDARQIDLIQRLRPATYWKTLSRRIEKAGGK
jgi:NAD(P)-dependent dehydrogenase (short-subunit alcohol dehydrogenase family)